MADRRIPLPHRRRVAWEDVRQIARQSIQAGHSFRETGARRHYRDWIALRAELSCALLVWSSYRDWMKHRRPSGG